MRTHYAFCCTLVLAVAGMVSGCSGADIPGTETSGASESNVASTAEKVIGGWVPTTYASQNLKVARNPSLSPYEWDDNGGCSFGGRVAHGNAGTFTLGTIFDGTWSPLSGLNACNLKAVGIAPNTSTVYAWWSNGTVSHGTSTSFTSGPTSVTFPSSLSVHGITSWNQLLEADVSPNGQVYYYWGSAPSSNVWRTVGTSTAPQSASTATHVAAFTFHGELVGISFNDSTGNIEAWYADGTYDSSTDSLNLAQ